MYTRDYIGRFVFPVFLREEELLYDQATEGTYRTSEETLVRELRKAGWDGNLSSLDPLTLLAARTRLYRDPEFHKERERIRRGLSEAERYALAVRTATALHEGLHFHQLIGTTFGRALFDLCQQQCQRLNAKALLSLGSTTEKLWRNSPPQSLEDVAREDLLISEILTLLLGDTNPTPSEAQTSPGSLGSVRYLGRHVQGDIYTITLGRHLYPLGGLVALESWAYALSVFVVEDAGGSTAKESYVRGKKQSHGWQYTLLEETLAAIIGESFTRLSSAERYGAIARVAFFALQVGFPFESDQHLIEDDTLARASNLPGYRLFAVLHLIASQRAGLWDEGPLSDILSHLIRELEKTLGWPNHTTLSLASALELSEGRARSVRPLTPTNPPFKPDGPATKPNWPVFRPSTAQPTLDVYDWMKGIYALLHSRFARRFLELPTVLFDCNTWVNAWQVNYLPWPPLNTYVKDGAEEKPVRRMWFNHFDLRDAFDAGMAVLFYVFWEILKHIEDNQELPTVCPLRERRIEWRCGALATVPCNLGGEEAFCPFEQAVSLVRGGSIRGNRQV